MLGRVRDFTHPALMTCPEKSPRTLRVPIAFICDLARNADATLFPAPLRLWQAAFALNLSGRILAFDATACEVLWRLRYGRDGNEFIHAILWLATGLGLPGLLALTLWLRWKNPQG